MKTKIFTIIVILLVMVTSGYEIYSLSDEKTKSTPAVNHGVMDLRSYSFSERGPIKLDGEWRFIPGHLVASNRFDQYRSYLVQVPSLWNKYNLGGEKVPKYTSGTYRLKILVSNPNQILAIKTNNIRMSNAIYINGRLVGHSGTPKENQSYMPHNKPYVSYFNTGKKEVEILVHVANFDYATGGGIISSIMLGDQNSIGLLRESSLAYDWVTIAAFLTMFIYFLGSYFHFKKDLQLLFFALFCLANVFYAATHGEKVFLTIFPGTPYEIFERLQVLSISIGLFALLYFYYSLKEFVDRRVVRVLSGIGIFMMSSAILPVYINSQLQMVHTFYLFLILLYVIYVQCIAILRKSVGAYYLIISSFTIMVYFIVETLNVVGNISLKTIPPLLPFICLLMLSLFISQRFTNTFLKKEELSNALMKVDKLKDEFLAKTSHEFRTPLYGIITISQSMLNQNKSSLMNEEKEKVSLIVGMAQRLSNLVNDILDFSKLKQGELQLSITYVDLYAVTHVVTEIFQYMIEKDIKIFNYVPRGQYVWADEERIRQILYNLIDNAVKHTRQGKVEINCFEDGEYIVIEVGDTGTGIPPENVNKIFEPFQQFGHSKSGSGLGLNITKQLVELQNGEIQVHSVLGKGSIFSIRLPKKVQIDDRMAREVETGQFYEIQQPVKLHIPYIIKNPDQKKIIIADDDHINLKVLIDTLRAEHYFIIAVDSGKKVVEQIKNHPDVDLVILDIMMPEISGYEVCQQLRRVYNLSELPVLMLTAALNPEDMIAAFQSGANDFLHKPVDTSELKTRIRNLILMKESAEEATKMEVAFLQAQIKPHFIYNVLNSILSLSYMDIDRSRKMLTDFATFLRGSFSFENTNKLVSLEKELAFVQSYVNLHRTRFSKQLDWEMQVENEIDCLIPPLMLQPLVENAILHGLKHKSVGGKVTLRVYTEANRVVFQVMDNGIGISQQQLQQLWNEERSLKDGVGLYNIVKRLKYYEDASIDIESKQNHMTTVVIKFPFIHEIKGGESVAKSNLDG